MSPTAVRLNAKLNAITDLWSPKIVAHFEQFEFRLAKLQGDFVWHSHPEADEAFLVLAGTLRIDFQDGAVLLEAGDLLVIPKGVPHKPYAHEECHVLLLDRAGTVNTGDAPPGDLTADPSETI